jgi:hypothetical protein
MQSGSIVHEVLNRRLEGQYYCLEVNIDNRATQCESNGIELCSLILYCPLDAIIYSRNIWYVESLE